MEDLKEEWGRYEYVVLERSNEIYESIQSLLTNQSDYPVLKFYRLIEAALAQEPTNQTAVNAANQIWNHVEGIASDKERVKYKKISQELTKEKKNIKQVKTFLKRMLSKYEQQAMLESLYFEF
nr:DUF1722 domain-containing protein [Marinilactibacillus kalidii]